MRDLRSDKLITDLNGDGHDLLNLGTVTAPTLYGGTGAGENLMLHSASSATKGKIFLGANLVYDEVNDRLGIGTKEPVQILHVVGGLARVDRTGIGSGFIVNRTDGSQGNLIATADSAALGFSTGNVFYIYENSATNILAGTAFGGTRRFTIQANADTILVENGGNVGIGTTDQFGSGARVIGIANATTAPTVTPTGGGVLYATAGELHWLGSSGTDTKIAPA